MGLFKRRNQEEYEGDFILEFERSAPITPEPPKSNKAENEFGITPWEQREHHTAPHAMTPDEILGKENEKEKSQKKQPDEETKPRSVISDKKNTETKAEQTPVSTPDSAPSGSVNEKADQLIRSIKSRAEKQEEVPVQSPVTPAEPEVSEKAEEKITEKDEEKAEPVAKTALSPKAQELYDRMMAERAKGKLNRQTVNESPAPAIKKTEPSEVIPEPEEIALPKKGVVLEPIVESEKVADAMFESLSENLNNPLRRRESESLLNKCKNYVTTEIPINPAGSIDDIIKEAELGARERLSNFYNSGEFTIPKPQSKPKYDFSRFTTAEIPDITTPDPVSGDTRIINIDSFSEESTFKEDVGKEVKNLQFSLADEHSNTVETPVPRSIDATRVVEIGIEGGRQADPKKAAEWRKHLEVLAEKEPEEAPTRMHLAGTDEPELPEGEVAELHTPAPAVEDYNSIENAESIVTDIAGRTVSVTARIIPTAAITLILAVCDYVFATALLQSASTFILLNIILLGIAYILNFNTVKGIFGIFTGSPDMDSPAALSSTMVLIYTIIASVSGSIDKLPILAPLGALTLLFNLLGKLSLLHRVRRGFKVVANDNEKRAITFIEDKLSSSVMAGGSVVGEALIAVGKKTKNVTGYLKNAYSEDAYEKQLSKLSVFTLIAAVVLAVVAFFVEGLTASLLVFTLVTIAACPHSSLLICNLPFGIASKKLKGYDAMLAGYSSVQSVANANAIAFDVNALFPAGSIKLYNMKVLNRGAVDKYIASAAALLTEARSPLAPIFEEILETNGEKIPAIDSIKFEKDMGLSGWIEDQRIFVGNRTLMEGHNIKTPSLELDKKILRGGYFPVYLAIGDQLCALFVVGYEADEEITYELRRLCNTGVTMLVNSNDPNVSDQMLCDYFGLYPDSIKVLSTSGVTAFKSATAFKESMSAPACFTKNICGLLCAITSAINLKSIISTLLIINIVLVSVSVGLLGYLAFSGVLTALSGFMLFLISLIPPAVTALVAYLKQP